MPQSPVELLRPLQYLFCFVVFLLVLLGNFNRVIDTLCIIPYTPNRPRSSETLDQEPLASWGSAVSERDETATYSVSSTPSIEAIKFRKWVFDTTLVIASP